MIHVCPFPAVPRAMKGVKWECPECGRRYKAKEQWADFGHVYETCMWVPLRFRNWIYARTNL